MTTLHRTVLGLALAGIAASSHAAWVTVGFDNPIFNGMPAPSYDGVAITYPKQAGPGSQSANVAAGRFQGSVLAYSGVDASIFVDSLNDLYMYCYDLYEHIGSGWVVNYAINLDGESARTLDFLGAVNKVLNQGSPTDDPYAWLRPSSGYMAAAIQLGIWESKYEYVDKTLSITSGTFRASGLESVTQAHLNSFFAAIGSSASLEGKYAMTLEAAGAQDMITGDPPTDVPEPGTLVLLGASLVGLVTTRRRAGAVSAAST